MAHLVERHSVCIFVSSTFVDMEVERDIINNEILNQLRDDFADINVDINFVDLRWGINTIDVENSNKRNEKILKVCMSEIDRCHPYFVGLLGKRYGWTPDDELLYSCFMKDDLEKCQQFFSSSRLSVTALETYHAIVQKKLDLSKCFLCRRDNAVYSCIPNNIRSNYIEPEKLCELDNFQDRIISYFTEREKATNLINYGGTWEENRFVPEKSFYDLLYKGLHDAIQQDLRTELSFNNEIERENYYQDLFIDRTLGGTIIRNEEINEIERLLNEYPEIVVHAPSGQGKSTFLCQLYNHLIENGKNDVLFYSAVASSNSTSMLNLIESLAYRIAGMIGEEYETIEKDYSNQFSGTDFSDYTSLVSKTGYENRYAKEEMSYEQLILRRLIGYVTKLKDITDKPLIILIDAYDRFEFSSLLHSLQWLKSLEVRVVITTITELATTAKTLASFKMIELPEFTEDRALDYIRNNCGRKELNKMVIQSILDRRMDDGRHAYSSPLWLKLVVHVLTSLDITDFQNIELLGKEDDKEQRIHSYMQNLVRQIPPTPGEALLYFINKAEIYIGRDFSTEVLQLIAFSDYGLRESDLEKLMEDRWSGLDFAVLHRWIRPYLIVGNENQWYLAHQLFVDAIKLKYKDAGPIIYDRLLKLCMELPEDDMIRINKGMLYVILAQQDFLDAVYYYTFNCRLPESIQQATNILVDYLRREPEYLGKLIKMSEKWDGDNYNRFMAERILFTLGNQLYKQGLFSLAKQLYLYYESVLERNIDELYVRDFFLPMIYDRLAIIYGNEYDKEKYNNYRQRAKRIRGDESGDGVGDEENSEHEEDLALEYASIINELYELSKDIDKPVHNGLYDDKYKTRQWTKIWVDELLHILGDMYASISCPYSHPQYEFWAQELPNAIKRYDAFLPLDESDWEIKIGVNDYSFFYKYNAMLSFMEFLLRQLVQINRDMALRMQHDCLCLYCSIVSSQQNEHYFDECALGHNLAGAFYLENGEIDKAINANFSALQYSSFALNIYPNSIQIRKRYFFANHSLGRCLFDICRYEDALEPLTVYHDGIKEILAHNPTQLTMVSSYLNALDLLGRCCLYLRQYKEAFENFDTMQSTIVMYLEDAPESIYFSWVTMLFNCKYYIARCYFESGHEDIGYQWANGLYNEMLNNGIPHDADYEPMENVRELLDL